MRLLIAFIAAMLVLVASAIEVPKTTTPPAPEPSTTQPSTEQPAQAPPPAAPETETAPAAAEEEEEEEELPPLPADVVPSGPPPTRFNPTEKVRADFPVSFPIDI